VTLDAEHELPSFDHTGAELRGDRYISGEKAGDRLSDVPLELEREE
jgi:hypothetical protein